MSLGVRWRIKTFHIMLGERPETADEWRDFYLAKEEYEAIEAIDGRAEGPRLIGARKAQQIRGEQRAAREEERHGEEMLAAAHANRRANQALSVGLGALILALIAILQQCRG